MFFHVKSLEEVDGLSLLHVIVCTDEDHVALLQVLVVCAGHEHVHIHVGAVVAGTLSQVVAMINLHFDFRPQFFALNVGVKADAVIFASEFEGGLYLMGKVGKAASRPVLIIPVFISVFI